MSEIKYTEDLALLHKYLCGNRCAGEKLFAQAYPAVRKYVFSNTNNDFYPRKFTSQFIGWLSNQENYRRDLLSKYYRRWYTYLEKEHEKEFYLTPIGELQKEYPDYKRLCSDFMKVNNFFKDSIADEFKIDTEKWEIPSEYT